MLKVILSFRIAHSCACGLAITLFVISSAPPSRGQAVTLTGTNYTQNFDNLGAGLPTGWSVWDDATANGLGVERVFDTTPSAWRLATAGVFANFASTDNVNPDTSTPFTQDEDASAQVAATNRAPGIRLLSSYDPGAAFVVKIQDTVGFTNFHLSVELLMMTTNARSGQWTIDYAIGATPTSFLPLGTLGDLTLSGTNALDSDAFGKTNGSFALPASVNDQGEPLWIRVALLTGTGPTGARDTYGMDNFSLTWADVPPSTNPPEITIHPQSRTNNATTTATFTVDASGASPLHYQWRKNDSDLSDGGNIAGATASTLIISSLLGTDAGGYSVVVTNNYGAETSSVATLTVIDPAIITQPFSRTNIAGDYAEFVMLAGGTVPMTYEWQLNGTGVANGIGTSGTINTPGNRTLTVTNVQPAHQGGYRVVVSNALGVTTSSVANLTIVPTPSIRLARWTFNSDPADADPTTGSLTPAAGTGTATAVGTSPTFIGGSSSDPASLDTDNSAWNIRDYPAASDENKLRGVQFDVSTVNYQDVFVTWEQQNNSRASRYGRLQYTTNGTDYVDDVVIDMGGKQGQFVVFARSLASVPDANNNPNFGFRIVTEFESTATGSGLPSYVPTDATSSYSGPNGVIRFDVVNVFANPPGATAPVITQIIVTGGNVQIDFQAGSGDVPGDFALQASATVNTGYTDVAATITALGAGQFRAVRALSGPQQYYRIRR